MIKGGLYRVSTVAAQNKRDRDISVPVTPEPAQVSPFGPATPSVEVLERRRDVPRSGGDPYRDRFRSGSDFRGAKTRSRRSSVDSRRRRGLEAFAVYRPSKNDCKLSLDSNAPGLGRVGQELAKFLFGTVQQIFGSVDTKTFRIWVRFLHLSVSDVLEFSSEST